MTLDCYQKLFIIAIVRERMLNVMFQMVIVVIVSMTIRSEVSYLT